MNEETKDTLELVRLGAACTRDADYLENTILELEEKIRQLKGDLNEQENCAEENDLLCTGCYLGRCVNRV